MPRYRAIGGPWDGQLIEMAEHVLWFAAPVKRQMGVFEIPEGKHNPVPEATPESCVYVRTTFASHGQPQSHAWVASGLSHYQVMQSLLEHYKPFADLVQSVYRHDSSWLSPKAKTVKGNFTA
jgi:hypothetical protein